MRPIEVVVVIVNYRTAELTLRALASLEPETLLPELALSVVVVENASGDAAALEAGIAARFSAFAALKVSDRNGGFGAGNNLGVEFARAQGKTPRYFHLLNPDTEIKPGAIRELVQFMEAHPEAGFTGSSLENEDGSLFPFAFRFPTVFSELEGTCELRVTSKLLANRAVARLMGTQPERVDWVPGASVMVRSSVFDAMGGFDESYFLYYEETDLFLRAWRAGWQCWYVPASRVMHIRGQSTGVTAITERPKRLPLYWFESRSRYYAKNYGMSYAMAADVAFLVGTAVGTVKHVLKQQPHRPHLVRDFVSRSVWLPRNRVIAPAVPMQAAPET
jgi:GT2 family glycosyltransferase